ncbi:hypothetical protein E9549_03985 [Blastococcus sp. MG754426]|uniref:hypothetical protein n=1 Tax=unclassified Blastococcus TaxID=2619396 RepID=UPI001EF0264B|nr:MULTISPECIES: hypothetical protein [unclassified Blastococcus]MCF6506571.1 hypothetical protein [Blastococcus sp. MG754426]MCF6510281.1 hypothetical protein [Blastococcus sp. MG754427]
MDDPAFPRRAASRYEDMRREAEGLVHWWRKRLADEMAGADPVGGAAGEARIDPRAEEALVRILGDLEIVAEVWTRPSADHSERPEDGGGAIVGGVRSWAPAGLLPDDPDLYALLDRVEHRLLQPLALATSDSMMARSLPAPLSDGRAVLAAYRSARRAIPVPGSSRAITAANGRWRLVGLHVVDPPEDALGVLQAALMELSAALAWPSMDEAGDAARRILLRSAARAATTPDALVGDLARVLALLDMPADRATLELRSLLAADRCGEVRLDLRQAELYRCFAQRTIPLVLDFHRVTPSLFDDPGPGC